MIASIPNILTLTRILLLPFFAATIIYKEFEIALLIFVIASVTDLLDGLTARITKQVTYFGTILDPIADKFFIITSFVLMSTYGFLPKWLTIIVISKDVIVLTGCIILYFVTNSLKIEAIFIGKLASASQFILIGLILIAININETFKTPPFLFISVAVLTTLAGLLYIYNGLKMANIEKR